MAITPTPGWTKFCEQGVVHYGSTGNVFKKKTVIDFPHPYNALVIYGFFYELESDRPDRYSIAAYMENKDRNKVLQDKHGVKGTPPPGDHGRHYLHTPMALAVPQPGNQNLIVEVTPVDGMNRKVSLYLEYIIVKVPHNF